MPLAAKLGIVVVVLVVLGGVGWYFLQGTSSDGTGADSPEEAVQNIATSLAADDLIGVMESLDPAEVGPLAEVAEAALARAGELELLEVTDTGLAELDMSVDGLEMSVEELHPQVARVTIEGGSIGADFTSPDLGLVLVSEDEVLEMEPETSSGGTSLADMYGSGEDDEGGGGGLDETFVIAVERDGGWYVSPLYTAAEAVRESEELGAADFAASREDVEGAESPIAAAEAMADAIEGLEPEQVVAALPPGEWGIGRDYLDSIMAEVDETELDESRSELRVDVATLELSEGEDLGNGRREVIIDKLEFSFDDEYEGTTEVALDGTCATVTTEDDSSRSCLDEWMAEEGLDPILADLVPEKVFVVAVEDDGGWYISPIETTAAYLKHAVAGITEEHLAAIGLVDPVTLVVGEPVTGELTNGFRRTGYMFDLEPGQLYATSIASDDATMLASVRPRGSGWFSDGTARATNDESDGSRQTGVFVAEEAPYGAAVGVRHWSGDDIPTGAVGYTIEVSPVETVGEIELDEPIEIDLAEGERVAYTFDSPGDIEALVVLDGDATVAALAPDGYSPMLDLEEPTTFYDEGEYTLVVTGASAGTATLTLEDPDSGMTDSDELVIDPPESLDGIPEIAIGDLELLTVEDDSIIDFVLEGTGDDLLVVVAADDDVFDPVAAVFDEDFELVVQDFGDPDERRIELTIPTVEGELYVISVAGFDAIGGDVRIRVSES